LEFNTEPVPFVGESVPEAKARMERALNALRLYRREWSEKLQRFGDNPLHDWTSNTADALRYLARGRRSFPEQRDRNEANAARSVTDYSPLG
jgi:phage terminase large subunit